MKNGEKILKNNNNNKRAKNKMTTGGEKKHTLIEGVGGGARSITQ